MLKQRIRTSKILLAGLLLLGGYGLLHPILNPPEPKLPIVPSEEKGQPVPDFAAIEQIKDRKLAFFGYLAPAVTNQNEKILQARHFILDMRNKLQAGSSLSIVQLRQIEALAKEYRVAASGNLLEQLDSLKQRVDIIPLELVLVQAANESAWGTSRFARLGYNFFGLWCFEQGCGFVPKRRIAGASHEVAKFDNLEQAVYSYLRNLNRHQAYSELRSIRLSMRKQQSELTAEALSEGLLSYSERGEDYINELQDMIRVNRKFMTP